MTIYAKLNAARKAFHAHTMRKSGRNSFAGYDYFELGDFVRPGIAAMHDAGLCPVVSFTTDTATMRIVDVETGEEITITSPMSEAHLKGCHPVQNVGAVETYQRRYLWMAALEIVEADAVDAAKPEQPESPPADAMAPAALAELLGRIDDASTDAAIRAAGKAALAEARKSGDKAAVKTITDHTLARLEAAKEAA